MLTDAVTLSMKGGIFESETKFKLFDKTDEKDYRAVVLFGRNGTGKSSIAKAFRHIRGEVFPAVQCASLLDKDEKIVYLSNEEKERIFIFDEDFVYNNVKLQEDHLETIVMLGEAANLTSQISAAETKKNEAEQNYIQMKKIHDEFSDENNIKSPDFYLKKIATKLKGDSNWAGRQRLITGAKVNAQVNNQTYLQFAECRPTQDKVELYDAFKEKLDKLEEAKSGAKVINQRVPEFSVLKTYPEQEIIDLLARKIDEPVITEREKRLLDLIRQGKAQDLNDRLRFFQEPDNTICPYCLQTLENQYKQTMVKSLEKVLNDAVKEHQDLLGKYVIKNTCDIDLSEFQILKDYSECSELVNQINTEILKINSLINTKIQNPYEPIILQPKLFELVSLLSSSLKSLEKQRQNFNSQALQTAPLLEELKKINNELAFLEIEDLVLQHHKQQEELSKAKNDLFQSENNYKNAQTEVLELEAKRKSVHVAIDTINAYLAYIFFSENRLSIEYSEGFYKLKSKGKSVKPCDISVGERNVIGLCYFFTNILKGQDKDTAYNKDYILVLDDPISSYDRENKIGIVSFLKFKLGQFLGVKTNTRVLLMSHDLTTIYDAQRFLSEIFEKLPKGKTFVCKELKNKVLTSFSFKSRQEYTEIVRTVYQYANGEASEYEFIIGNVMRQMLEAFSTFEYRLSIEEVSVKDDILNLLQKDELITYYKNLMYRLVLNGGSHRKEQVATMVNLDFFSLISPDEKKRTARDILTFIYILNPTHLLKHLEAEKRAKEHLDSWKREIEQIAMHSEIS